MSRLTIDTPSRADLVMEQLYKDLERRIESSPPGLCPVDLSRAFLELCHAQTCGKCVPCRVGLGQLNHLIRKVLNGNATMETLDTMEQTAKSIMESADCAIGYEAAHMVYKGLIGYRDDYIEHIKNGRCTCTYNQPVPCVSLCPAHVDIPDRCICGSELLFQLPEFWIRTKNLPLIWNNASKKWLLCK